MLSLICTSAATLHKVGDNALSSTLPSAVPAHGGPAIRIAGAGPIGGILVALCRRQVAKPSKKKVGNL